MSATDASQQANRSELDPRRILFISYFVFAVVLALFLSHVLGPFLTRYSGGSLIEGVGFELSDLIGGVLALAAALFCWFHPAVRTYSLEVASELMRVTWPTAAETRVATIAVIVASVVAGLILFAFDSISFRIMVEWLPSVWGKL